MFNSKIINARVRLSTSSKTHINLWIFATSNVKNNDWDNDVLQNHLRKNLIIFFKILYPIIVLVNVFELNEKGAT